MMGVLGGCQRGECANKCVNAWSMSAYASVPPCEQRAISFSLS